MSSESEQTGVRQKIEKIEEIEGSLRSIELPEVDSTSAYIKRNSHLWKENFLLVFTFNQTAGKGQNGRVWLSQKNKDIAFSFIFHPDGSVLTKYIPCVTLCVGLAVLRVLKKFTKVDLQIKWPNDIQYSCGSGEDKKLAGVLCELLIEKEEPIVIAGVGVNVNSTTFDAQIAHKTTSVKNLVKQTIPIKKLLFELWSEIRLVLGNFRVPMSQELINEINDSFGSPERRMIDFDQDKHKREAVVLRIDSFGSPIPREQTPPSSAQTLPN